MSEGIPPPEVYLDPAFNSASLKVSHLRGILLDYSIHPPSTAKKPDLLLLFEQHVRAHASEILSERDSVVGSDAGIEEVGNDGQVMHKTPAKKTVAKKPRQSTAKKAAAVRSSVAPRMDDDDGMDAGPEDTPAQKRITRRSLSAAPSTSASTPSGTAKKPRTIRKKPSNLQGMKMEEDQDEDEEDGMGDRIIVGKDSNPQFTTTTQQRTPIKSEQPDLNPAFSDYNPFQSGGEGSGSDGPGTGSGKGRKKRASLAPTGDAAGTPTHAPRRSLLRNEAGQPSAVPVKQPVAESRPPRQQTSTPHTSPLKRVEPDAKMLRTPPDEWKAERRREIAASSEEEDAQGFDQNEMHGADEQVDEAVLEMEAALEGGAPTLSQAHKPDSKLTFTRLLSWAIPILFLLFGCLLLGDYKSATAELGFCDTDSDANSLTRQLQLRLQRDEDCKIAARKAQMEGKPVLTCDEVAWYHSTKCTPCPEFGKCAIGSFVECLEERVQVPHPLAFTNTYLNGLPGLGPIAFPPTCERNFTQDNMIMNYAKGIEAYLAREKGRRICEEGWVENRNEDNAVKYGIGEKRLYQAFWDVDQHGEPGLRRILQGALKDLIEHNDVVKQFGSGGEPFYMATQATIPFKCRARMTIVREAHKHRWSITGIIGFLTAVMAIRSRLQQRSKEARKVKGLVGVALERLQEQQYRNQIDTAQAPEPFLRPAQLRDFVLSQIHNAGARQRLWNKVQPIIESNANVRSGEREVDGDSWQVWEWIGVSKMDSLNEAMLRNSQRSGM